VNTHPPPRDLPLWVIFTMGALIPVTFMLVLLFGLTLTAGRGIIPPRPAGSIPAAPAPSPVPAAGALPAHP
jgi:hypothetical protein